MNPTISQQLRPRDLVIEGQMAHRIDHSRKTADGVAITDEKKEFGEYLFGLISDVSRNTRGRKFRLTSPDTQVISAGIRALRDKDYSGFPDSAKRLLEHETEAQKKVEHLQREIPGGILLHALIVDNGVKMFVICKAENSQFLDDGTFKRTNGYPLKRHIYRSVRFMFDSSDEISDIKVFDSSTTGASYWWKGFLELAQYWDDDYNTQRAFDIIDKKVLAPLKKKFPADHMFLRNATIRYFRKTAKFELENFIEKVLGEHPTIDDTVDLDELKGKVRALPEKWEFDSQFQLIPSLITARVRTVIPLTENIDLVLKRDIEIPRFIQSIKDGGQKYIRIKTDEGYDAFLQQESPAQ